MLHTKAWLVDYEEARGGLAYVGAANATQRSHLSDNEAGILSTSPAFAREVYERLFRPDIDTASHREVDLNFHVVRSSNPAVRASRWLRRVLVDLLWFI
jgi:phosphatidylserine/phosphatidylglycerophosphate/cardiolipin synthase-like enzyme